MTCLQIILLPILGYLAGSIPFGVILARLHGVNLRQVGSGNVGATNVGRALGRRWGVFCFLLDVLKGTGPVLLAGAWLGAMGGTPSLGTQGLWLGTAAGCVLGHVFPVWLRFRGGKGVATSLGVVLGIWPFFTLAGLAAFGVWIVVTGLSRYVSLGSIVAAVTFMGFFIALHLGELGELWLMTTVAAVLVVLVIVRHRANIVRLLRGEENRIGRSKSAGTT
jgi:glycerol-3-phosphate acyltransferase PlsY